MRILSYKTVINVSVTCCESACAMSGGSVRASMLFWGSYKTRPKLSESNVTGLTFFLVDPLSQKFLKKLFFDQWWVRITLRCLKSRNIQKISHYVFK